MVSARRVVNGWSAEQTTRATADGAAQNSMVHGWANIAQAAAVAAFVPVGCPS